MLNLKLKRTKLNLNLNKHSLLRIAHMCLCITVHNCRTQHSTEHSGGLPSYPPDNHHSSGDVWVIGLVVTCMTAVHMRDTTADLCLSRQSLRYTALDTGCAPLLHCLGRLSLPPFVLR